uniref:Uncharacterized protein n=1 Tax=Anolis carolinensis TaxID=28377 RepID=A0A803TDA0_ANOCA
QLPFRFLLGPAAGLRDFLVQPEKAVSSPLQEALLGKMIEGKGHMMHLREKRGYVPQNFPVFSYSKQGELQVDYPFIRRNCFYQGYIEGKPSSLVTVSTCSGGFRGLFQLENKTYEIEPVQASPTFQHIVYRLEEKEIDSNVKCGLTEEEQNRQMAIFSEYSMVFAHELGHNLGMRHDGRQCDCDRSVCIMTEVLTNGYRFSNCSQNDYYNMMNQHCLFFPPDPDKAYRRRYCGNKIVEDGEQCDCGTKQQCQTDLCCQPDCKLRKDVICAFGDCCVNCNYIPAQVPCRKNVSVCDLPEYCNGSSQWCPADVYVQDGAPCGEGLHCYHGRCILPNEQCKMMFGIRSTAASEGCFRNVNSKGDRFGNCGFRNGTYIKCKQRHVMFHTDTGNRECWDGTPCGPDRLCINQQCETVASLNYDCDFNQCFNRGICNNLKHCHCDYGWAPPKCFNKGFGGSVDSGPPPRQKRRLIMSSKAKLFSYIFLPVVAIITCFIIVFRNDLIYLYTRLKERLQARRKKHAERFRRRKDLTAIQMRMMQNA